jgi:pyridoxal 5'-phosphate synthase pdxS subunit
MIWYNGIFEVSLDMAITFAYLYYYKLNVYQYQVVRKIIHLYNTMMASNESLKVKNLCLRENGMCRQKINRGFAEMFKNGVIMDVTSPDQARIAEEAGACAVMALERVPADIRRDGHVARMSDPAMIQSIMQAVTIPVMAKVRIGHFAEARILEALGVDFVDESEVLTPADENRHVDKSLFNVPFVCGARNLGEAARRINEGAVMIRTKGEAGTGDIVEAVRHLHAINEDIATLNGLDSRQLSLRAADLRIPQDLLQTIRDLGRLPVVNFAAGGVATPADAALMMAMGADGVFVGSGIFKAENPARMAKAMVQAVIHHKEPERLAKISMNLGTAMAGLERETLNVKMAERGV